MHTCSYVVIAASLAIASPARAESRRLVVLDFDGPRALADTGRNLVMSVLAGHYDVIATKRWESARARARGHGPQQWRAAAKQAGVDVVIEGWVQDEGRRQMLTLAVRDAATGNEIDTVSIKLRPRGPTEEASRNLATQLGDVLAWVDGDATAEARGRDLPDVRDVAAPTAARARPVPTFEEDDGGDVDTREPPTRPARSAPERAEVSAVDDESRATRELLDLFGPDSKEAEIVSERKPARVMRPAPRFVLAGGGFVATRGMTFEQNPPDSTVQAPDYPAQTIAGLALEAEVFPRPVQALSSQTSGIGFSFKLARSLDAQLAAFDPETETYGAYTLEHTAYEGAVRYRHPIDLVTLDGEAAYGRATYQILDLPGGVQIPDTSYSFMSAGGHVELAVTERASVALGGRLIYLLSAGDVNEQDWYGAGSGSALALDARFSIPLSDLLSVRGALEYRRFALDFEQSGRIADELDVSRLVDSSISGAAQLVVQF